MTAMVTVRPGDDRRVRMPNGRMLTKDTTPPEGVSVARDLYIERRLACGDLVEVTKLEPAAAQPAAKLPLPAASDSKGA